MCAPVYIIGREVYGILCKGVNLDWCPVVEGYGQIRVLAVAEEPTAHKSNQFHRGGLGDYADGKRLSAQGESVGKVSDLAVREDFQFIHRVMD